jgi:biopolymer transport protein ExbB
MYPLLDYLQKVEGFLDAGGIVLYIIAAVTLVMWTLVFERYWYFTLGLKSQVSGVITSWEARAERRSWNARQIRRMMISQVSEAININMAMIKALVALCPLLGLLGTVYGMIEVFNIMAVTGGGDARQMASGVSQATIPTMAGMVAALSGVFANTYLTRIATRERALLEDHLTMDH